MHWEYGDLGIHAGLFTHVSLVLFLIKSGFPIPLGDHYHGADPVPSKKMESQWKVLSRSACQADQGPCSLSLSLS